MDKIRYVLVIEDTKQDSDAIAACLEKRGLSYKLAKNSSEALQIAQGSTPMLIILDLVLPGINGFKVAQLLKKDEILKDVPILVTSILDKPSDKELARQIGIAEYMTKPISGDKFRDTLSKYV
jgi:CheY-like chemotaxis protein